jgi:hypothetical protein
MGIRCVNVRQARAAGLLDQSHVQTRGVLAFMHRLEKSARMVSQPDKSVLRLVADWCGLQ